MKTGYLKPESAGMLLSRSRDNNIEIDWLNRISIIVLETHPNRLDLIKQISDCRVDDGSYSTLIMNVVPICDQTINDDKPQQS